MTIRHHLDDATILARAAGALDPRLSFVADCHIAMCPACRERLHHAESIGGALLEEEDAVAMRPGALDAMFARIDRLGRDAIVAARQTRPAMVDGTPAPLARLLGTSLDEVPWRSFGPGAQRHVVWRDDDGGSVQLLRFRGGMPTAAHGHDGGEMTLILQGAYRDEIGLFEKGDVSDVGGEVEHRPVTVPGEPCICLIGCERPLRFKNLAYRILQPIIGV